MPFVPVASKPSEASRGEASRIEVFEPLARRPERRSWNRTWNNLTAGLQAITLAGKSAISINRPKFADRARRIYKTTFQDERIARRLVRLCDRAERLNQRITIFVARRARAAKKTPRESLRSQRFLSALWYRWNQNLGRIQRFFGERRTSIQSLFRSLPRPRLFSPPRLVIVRSALLATTLLALLLVLFEQPARSIRPWFWNHDAHAFGIFGDNNSLSLERNADTAYADASEFINAGDIFDAAFAELRPASLVTSAVSTPKKKETAKSKPAELTAAIVSDGVTVVESSVPKDLRRDMSKVKFLAGMIAVHLPTIPDCGALAKDIVEISNELKADPFLIASVISVESRFGSNARSKAGAQGLMQLLPTTASHVAASITGKKISPKLANERVNIRLGVTYLKELEARYKNKNYALAAYNWGPTKVDTALRQGKAFPRSVTHYARTIVKRAASWHDHFDKAERGASALASKKAKI